ncbi:hypothetical protein GCK32_004027, partial [Trichostrongylus colubriformis]
MDGGEASTGGAAPIEVAIASKESVIDYVKTAGLALLGAMDQAAQLEMILDESEAVMKFISDPQTQVLVVDRTVHRDQSGDADTGDESESVVAVFTVRNDVLYRTDKSTSIVYVKRGGILEADKAIADQLRVMVLNEGNPYETLFSLIGKAVTPYFKSFIKESGRGERDGDKLAPTVEKNLNEAEVALLHLQQNIDIPEINLVINPHIQAAIQKANKEGRKAKVTDLGDLVEDAQFLNSLQSGVNRWIKEIRKVTKLERDPGSGSSLQEMTFWLNLERALQKILQKRESEEVTLTLEALKCGKRFHATVSFDTDTGLKQTLALVTDYNSLMKDFPLNELVSASDLDSIKVALGNVFGHMKKIRATKYPVQRALRFIEAISRDMNGQILKVLGTRRLMHISIVEFDQLMMQCIQLFTKWDDEYDKFITLLRDISKKKRDEPVKLMWKVLPLHKKLEGRLVQIKAFRKQHEQLRVVIARVLRPAGTPSTESQPETQPHGGEMTPVDQVNLAYEFVKEVDCLDVSIEGTTAWDAAQRRYEEQIARVETAITSRLRDQLGSARNANEMFSIFSRFNALFCRPQILGAVREYQTQLIQRVKEDIERLQAKFTKHYAEKRGEILTPTFDIPPVSANIIWIRQIERQLTLYMQRVASVLGTGWENHVEARQLKSEADNFRKVLDTQPLFENWVEQVLAKGTNMPGRVFVIDRRSKDGKPHLHLKVNFSPESIVLHKEVRNLKNMGFRIPLKVVNAAHQANQIYPFAISLLESTRTYESINERLAQKTGIDTLIASYKKDIQSQIADGYQLNWESYKIDPYVTKLADTVNNYQERVEDLILIADNIEVDLAALDTCQYNTVTIGAQLASIQKSVDQLALGNYSNLTQWVDKLDKKIEAKLAARVEEAIRLWTLVYSASEEVDEYRESNVALPPVHPVLIEIRLTAQTIYISPSIEQARAKLLEQLVEWHAVVTSQPRISSTRFQLAMNRDLNVATYKNILSRLPNGLGVLEKAYTTVDRILREVDEYVNEWLRYQALWDLQAEMLYERLGTDLSKWMKTLVEIRKSRSTFDTQDTKKEIFPVIVDYAKVQLKVTLKYDYWHKEVLQKFGTAVGNEMQQFFGNISKWREELESQGVDSGTTTDAVALITYVQTLKKQTKVGQETVDQFRAAQRLLSQQRYQFPAQWLYAENVEGEWSALTEILLRKDSSIQSQERVEDLILIADNIEVDLAALDTCQYNTVTIGAQLASIQKSVDQLALGNYSNLTQWVDKLDKKVDYIDIEAKLAARVEEAIRLWTLVYSASEEVDEYRESNVALPPVHPVLIEIRLTAQTIYISPSIEQARAKLLEQLVEWHAVVTSQPRISSTRFQLAMNRDLNVATYKNILSRLPNGLGVLEKAYTTVDRILREVDEYVNEWLRYQALWDLQAEMLYERLGTDLSKWMKTLVEIRKSRSTFDTQDTKKEIFPVIVDYAKVQLKVTLKYDYWHKEVLQKFGTAVGNEMQQFFGNISKWREELESQGVDSGTTTDAVALITYVQTLKKQTKVGQETVDQFRAAQRLLSQQRYQFPAQWLYAENVEGEWSALTEILLRKDSSIQSQVNNLQTKIREENEMVEKRTQETLSEWERAKPVEGAQRPNEALAALNTFEQKIAKLSEDREKMRRARHALDMADPAGVPVDADKLAVAAEELADLKGVWQALTPIYTSIDEMKEKTWLSVQPRKLRQSLDELMNQLKHLPVKYKSYKSYEYAKQMMHNYSKMNMLVMELKSEALKERHWRQMMKELRVNWNLSDLTLGQVWDADLQRHENAIKQILLVAQGELALEEFLKQMKDFWQSYDVELVNYQNKTRLIKGWDELFNKLKEHQNSLAAMKLSPYYKQFEENALSWEEKLNRISAMFDVWIDVQRRWVYLEGLFSGSADIATLLPIESARFSSISTEFLALMKKVTQAPRILDVVGMQGAQRLLDRLADMLSKIQKALGEYLERERASFPRFYFVGDEDLLEIMGNSKDITRLQKHLKKMFAGVTAIDVGEEDRIITALHSREGERVDLVQPVHTKDVRINDWLKALEAEMKHTLARLLGQSLAHFSKLDIDTVTPDQYMEWLDKYPAQVIGLTAEIWWSNQMEIVLSDGKNVESVEQAVSATLSLLADSVLKDQPAIRRKKIEALITEFVHKRDACRRLAAEDVKSQTDFGWLQCMRFYFDPKQPDASRCCVVKIANAQFHYGFEYLGIQERLVRTPLTDRCYLTMTQALHSRLGGSPFGPAGTGKTESVKALGHQLGRFVLVFNCDETFDFQAMGRILVGLCQVGAWGCFDEFNRLEERMLSAVSQQIQTIQEAVRAGGEMTVDLVGKRLNVNPNIGIFITMNPGYSGRSNLPDNLKQLFRSLAMTQPDRQLIAQVMLFSQGFRTAEVLANKIVPLFILCKEQLSSQCHYDFGLRALKYVLVSAGNVKRDKLAKMGSAALEDVAEQQMLIQSVCETLVPKLVSEDIALLFSLLSDVFPSIHYTPNQMIELRQHIAQVCDELMLCHADTTGELGAAWVEKVLQLYQITNLNHGLMLVGPSGSGKTMAWKVLLKALERFEKIEGVAHVIDAKAMSKDALYGVLDPNTREWTDGLFTSVIRRIIDNVRGESDKRQWIIFDGDVDPEWVENLNSVLDDNKLLTLPNGERLAIPPNVRIIFEVADLKYATLATVSRCGMVWFSDEIITTEMMFEHHLSRLRNVSIESDAVIAEDAAPTRSITIQRQCAAALQSHFSPDGLVPLALNYALANLDHIMVPTQQRLLSSFFSMMNYSVRCIINHDATQGDFPLS